MISDKSTLRFQFDGIEQIDYNSSGLDQDIFVLMALNGKKNGTYIEIGANDPIHSNNTYLLETLFGWRGFSVEIESDLAERFNTIRQNPCIDGDAMLIDYGQAVDYLNLGNVIDYLSVDIEPPYNTFAALQRIPHDRLKFRTVTFEHDYYTGGLATKIRGDSRIFMDYLGYELLVSDVAINNCCTEDWWIHPDLVDKNIAEALRHNAHQNDYPPHFINFNEYMYPK